MISGLLLGLSNAMAQAPVANFSATPTAGCGPLGVNFTDQSSNTPLYWSWDFGNGVTSSAQNPSCTYTVPGTYTVKLIVRNSSGSDAIQKINYITVYPFPNPQFTSNLTLACNPASIQFTDQSTPGQGNVITSWAWNFGDGATSTQQDASHTYTATGYYTAQLKVTNSGGCSNTLALNRYLRVVDGIQPTFVFNQSSTACTAPFTGQLLNQTAGPGNLSFAWTVSNGATPSSSADTSPVVTFPTSGQYNVTLQVNSSLGCSATAQQTLPFANGAAILNGPTTACVNTPVTYSDGSTPAPSTIIWTFSDGTSSNTSSISKTFTATGAYMAKLVNKYATCADSTIETINVVSPPTANFTTSTPTVSCKAPLTIQFTDQTTPAATGWQWDFGDGQTSTQKDPSHTYTTPGSFNVTLTATGPGNCPNTLIKNGLVVIQAPTVSIGGTLGACTAATPTFNTISPTANVASVDGVASYAWSAPGSNEGSFTAATPTFTYAAAGSYTLNVTVTTTGGCSATASTSVQIGTPLVPTFTPGTTSPCNSTPVNFSSSTGSPGNTIWNFGDTTAAATGNTAIHSYHYYGPHTVILTVYNNGCPQQTSQVLTVKPPFAGFTYAPPTPVDCNNESLIQFTDTSYEGPNPPYGPITWLWTFGDGGTSTAQSPQHLYPVLTSAPASYPVSLTVTQDGCTSTANANVVIGSITTQFTQTQPGPICRNRYYTFTSTSTPLSLISTYAWQFDGNTTAPSTSPTYQTNFPVNGPGTIELTVTDIYGCKWPITTPIQVIGALSRFSVPASGGGCINQPTTFMDNSTPAPAATNPILKWTWNFGDNSTPQVYTTNAPATHPYADTGYYSILLTVDDAEGCSDAFAQNVHITNPTPNFGIPYSFYCPAAPLTFIDSSQGYNLTDVWNFGDGTTSTTPVHTFLNNGQTYNVTLTVTDINSCTNSITKPILIQSPIAAFNIYDTTAVCYPLETIFAAHGQYYDSLYWRFGDGNTSTLDSTSHFYNNYGTDTAKLFLEGPGGCLDSASRRVQIIDPYTGTGFTYGPPPYKQCDSVPMQFEITPPINTTFMVTFGDNTTDSSGNTAPFHMYRNPSNYGPNLFLTDPTGCIVDVPGANLITVLGATPFFSVNKHSFCDSGLVSFTDYTISNDGFASESYNFGDGSPIQTQRPGNGTFNPTHDYDFPGRWTATLQVSTSSGCAESYSDTIRVYQSPHPVIILPAITCTGLIQFQGSTTVPQADSVSWAWNFGNGQTSPLQNPAIQMTPGSYLVTLQASSPNDGCTDTTSSPLTVNPLPEIKGPHEITTPVGIPVTIPFTYSQNVVTWVWTPASDLSCTDCGNPVATVIFSTTYTITVTDVNSCTAADTILVKTICNDKNYWFPNTFSPNGDGVNDWFYPRGTSLYNIQSLTIFNRWGQMVFQRRDFPANAQNLGWDGTFGGKQAPSDAYVYIAEVICENAQVVTLSGNVTLIR
jgi:gliding motility-associated-like protein